MSFQKLRTPVCNFNPRPPWGGRRCIHDKKKTYIVISIHALRGEGDDNRCLAERVKMLISIHALRGEGDIVDNIVDNNIVISIHALRGEGDSILTLIL